MRKSTNLWIKSEVRAWLFRGALSGRARPAADAVGGDQLSDQGEIGTSRRKQSTARCINPKTS